MNVKCTLSNFRTHLPQYPNLICFWCAVQIKKLLFRLWFQEAVHSSEKSSLVVFPSPQKADIPASKPTLQSVNSPQKSSNQGAPFMSSPDKTVSSSLSSVTPSPLQNQAISRGLNHISSPQKSGLHDSPTISGSLAHQEKSFAGAPGEFGGRIDTPM